MLQIARDRIFRRSSGDRTLPKKCYALFYRFVKNNQHCNCINKCRYDPPLWTKITKIGLPGNDL